MFARTFAGLFIVMAVITLGYLAASQITPSATSATLPDEINQQPAPQAAKRPLAVLILGNIITALVSALLYGFAAGAFN